MKDHSQAFSELYEIIDKELSSVPSQDVGIHYSGTPYTGDPSKSDILLLSINPGFPWESWRSDRQCREAIQNPPNKYIDEYLDGSKFAKNLVGTLCKEDLSMLDRAVETYISSPYSTPDQATLNATLNNLTPTTRQQHDNLVTELLVDLLTHIQPEVIVCCGVSIYDQAKRVLGKIDGYQVIESSTWQSKTTYRHYIDQPLKNGTRLLGCKHLSMVNGDEWIQWFRDHFDKSLSSIDLAR